MNREDTIQNGDIKTPGPVEDVEIQRGGKTSNGTKEGELAALQKTITETSPTMDLQLWTRMLQRLGRKVCRIEVDEGAAGTSFGTGFLVGPDLVLTNYHVIQALIKEDNKVDHGSKLIGRFDYENTRAVPTTGVPVHAMEHDWLVASGIYTPEEAEGQPDLSAPDATQLDFALIRLATPIGLSPAERGWVPLPTTAPAIYGGMPLIIVQHPKSAPLKFTVDTSSVMGLYSGDRRLRYRTNTESGASGAPVFDIEGRLVAMHHLGYPAWPANAPTTYNQGIPIATIYRRLKELGMEEHVCISSPESPNPSVGTVHWGLLHPTDILSPESSGPGTYAEHVISQLKENSEQLERQRKFHGLGTATLVVTMLFWATYQVLRDYHPGPLAILIGLGAIPVLELILLKSFLRCSGTVNWTAKGTNAMPSWWAWAGFVGVPLYVCGHFLHMMMEWKIIGLATPEYGQHARTVLSYPAYFGWSELNWKMLLDGRPHYRWLHDRGFQAYPMVQPWLYVLLTGFAALLWARAFHRWCFPARAHSRALQVL